MNAEIMGALEQLEREKGIPKDYMLEKISAALLAAYKKDHTGYTENVMVSVVDGELKMFVQKEAVEELMFPDTEISLDNARKLVPDAVEGDIINVEVDARQFGRIAAKTAKDVIIQGIREAEHTVIFDKFTSKSHEMITGTVLRIEPDSGDMLIRIATGAAGTGNGTDKTNALLAAGEQVRGESYTEGDSIRVYVVDVRRSSHGPQVIVSRTHPGLVKRLFEREVPEIADGTVEVKSIAREAGNRTKLAVRSPGRTRGRGRGRAGRREDGYHPVLRGSGGIRGGGPVSRRRGGGAGAARHQELPRGGSGRSAFPCHRQGGPERPAGSPPDRI